MPIMVAMETQEDQRQEWCVSSQAEQCRGLVNDKRQ